MRAGITSTVAMFPLETVRTRLAVDHAKYRGVATAFRTIVASEGLPALYRVRAPPCSCHRTAAWPPAASMPFQSITPEPQRRMRTPRTGRRCSASACGGLAVLLKLTS